MLPGHSGGDQNDEVKPNVCVSMRAKTGICVYMNFVHLRRTSTDVWVVIALEEEAMLL